MWLGSCSGYIRTSGLWLLGGPNCPPPPPTYLGVISRIQHLLQQSLCGYIPPCSQANLALGITDWTGTSPGLRILSQCSVPLRSPCVSSWLLWRLSVKESACNVGDASSIPGWEDTLEEEKASHSTILAWEMTEEPGWGAVPHSMVSQRVRHDWSTEHPHVRTAKGLLWTLVSLARHLDLPRSWQTSVANNTGGRLKAVFEQVQGSRSTPGLGWWQNIYEVGSGQCLWGLRKKWIQRCFCGRRGLVSILYGIGG